MSKDRITGEMLYSVGTYACNNINPAIDRGDYQLVANLKGASTDSTWLALIIGHIRGAWGMYMAFDESIGMKEDPYNKYLATLMYQLAKKFNSYTEQEDQEKIIVPSNMNPIINKLYDMVIDANKKYSKICVSMDVLSDQMNLFREEITLPNGKSIDSYLFNDIDFLMGLADSQGNKIESSNVVDDKVELSGDVVNDEDNIVENPSCWDNCSVM